MSFDLERLYGLLPAIHRRRDAEAGEPLRALLAVLADQIALLEEDLARLHDDQFVETCAPWVLPYIADLIGLRGVGAAGLESLARAEVANTIGYRRRKGTAAMLEQLARDVTGWPARVVEYFQLLAGTQFLNHLRPRNVGPLDLRDATRLEWLDTPFERLAGQPDLPHTVDVRRIDTGRGRYNIPSLGVFLWRLRAHPVTRSPAVPDAGSARRFRFGQLGHDVPLFGRPQTETEVTHLAGPVNVPMAISRRMLVRDLPLYYGAGLSLQVWEPDGAGGFVEVGRDRIVVCDLTGWVYTPPPGKVALDPELGRLVFPEDRAAVQVTFHLGFGAPIGGGEYDRLDPRDAPAATIVRVPDDAASIGAARAALAAAAPAGQGDGGVVEIGDSGRYVEAPVLDVRLPAPGVEGGSLVVRAANHRIPAVVLGDAAAPGEWLLGGDDGAEIILDGLLIGGGRVRVPAVIDGRPNRLRRLELRHGTLVPGLGAAVDGVLQDLSPESLIVEIPDLELVIDRCVVGGLRVHERATVRIEGSIVDATADDAVAFAAPGGGPGAPLRVVDTTIVGRVHTTAIELASNTLFAARPPPGAGPDDPTPVHAVRRQTGCVRFSHVPLGAHVPRRFECHPVGGSGDPARDRAEAIGVYPVFESLRYGDPAYGQLSALTAAEIRTGADDESEMGVFRDRRQPLREAYLRGRLAEYLPFGLEVGIFYAT